MNSCCFPNHVLYPQKRDASTTWERMIDDILEVRYGVKGEPRDGFSFLIRSQLVDAIKFYMGAPRKSWYMFCFRGKPVLSMNLRQLRKVARLMYMRNET